MMFKSIRSRLALSFAGIALVAALALGAVLLVILRNYYANQEFNYLVGNAQAVSRVMAAIISTRAPHEEVQLQIENLAFLTQTRIQVYAPDEQLLYDSGSPQDVSVNFGVMKQTLAQSEGALPKDLVFISVGDSKSGPALPSLDASPFPAGKPIPGNVIVYRSIQAGGSAYGFELKLPGDTASIERAPATARSDQSITMLMMEPKTNQKVGIVQLLEGPAYGSDILKSVAWGWAFSSIVAILLAALIGWYISRRISAPVLALTHVTAHMTRGDLSSRADIESRDEFGQLARSFNEMADQVETTVSTLRAFVSDAAHELNTPLTALKTNLELALNERDPLQKEVFLGRALEQNQRLEQLASGLLDLSRIETNHTATGLERFNLSRVITETGERFASRAEQAERSFDLALPESEIFVQGNAQQIQRAVENLLENALKFTSHGGSITMALQPSNQGVLIRAVDTGIGIPPEDLPHIFERFHRGRNSAEFPGNGLGLAIVKAIVEAHGGSVRAENAESGKGSVFSIWLPVTE